jgi:hypothetical protein
MEGKAPATVDVLKQMLALCPDTLARDTDRLRVRIRRSKTDQEGQGAEVAILRGCRLRPVEAVQSWLAGC